MATKKNIIDSIMNLNTKFGPTDEGRIDEDWLSYKIDQVRVQLIVEEYNETGILSQDWLSNCGLIMFHNTNAADDRSVTCACDISKTIIPQTIPLKTRHGNQDLGIYSLVSACNNYGYYFSPMYRWGKNLPPEHTNSLFRYYFRVNTELYVSHVVEKLRLIALLVNPEDGVLMSSAPIASGSLVNTIVYKVIGAPIIYNSAVILAGATFTANATTTYSGTGLVYLNNQVVAARDTDVYPCSGDMIRRIELEILTKEFNIEKSALVDVMNDSTDDAKKTVQL